MSETNKIKFQIDVALKIQEKIERATDKAVPLADVLNAVAYYGVTSDYNLYHEIDNIYAKLGFDYDVVEGI